MSDPSGPYDTPTPASARRAPWRPLLTGARAERARTTIQEIAAALTDVARNVPGETLGGPTRTPLSFPSIGGGLAGVSLFFAYLNEVEPDRGHDDTAVELLDRAIDSVSEIPSPPWLYGGFPGVAWVGEHLQGRLFETDDEEDPGEEIASALQGMLGQSPWVRDYDLISGLVGLGVYALERSPRPGGQECMDLLVDRLAETSETRPEGLTWWTRPELLPDETRKEYPEGNYNLGVAHGVPGIIGLLGDAIASGKAPERAKPLLEGAVSWLLAQKLPPDAVSIFSYNIAPDDQQRPTRLAWCYGDLGIAVALLAAARGAGNAEWEKEALAIARAVAERSTEISGVVDAGLCHGAVGNAHLYNRLFQATGDPLFEQAAVYWYERMYDFQRPGEGVAGFPSWGPDENRNLRWTYDPGFLTGTAGIGLALLAATSPIEPDWDRLLVVSVHPQQP